MYERRLHTVFLFYRNTLHNKILQTLICVRIHVCKQTSQQYFAPKSVQFRIRHAPFFLLLKLPAANDFLLDLEWDDDIVWDDSLSESTDFDVDQFLDTLLK